MSCVRIRMLLATSLVLAMLMALAGCGGGGREHARRDQDRYPERYERHDDRGYEKQPDSGRHEDRERQSGRDRGDHDKR
jgi:hypothetical protein